MKNPWYEYVLSSPKRVSALYLILVILLAIGMQNLYFRGDYKTFFEEQNPQRLAYEQMQDTFNKTETISILIAPNDKNIFTPETLKILRELTEAAWYTPYSIRVDSLTNYQHTQSVEDDLYVDKLVAPTLPLTPENIAYVKSVALSEPDLVQSLVDPQGEVAVISITVRMGDDDQTHEVMEVTQFIRNLTTEAHQQHPNLQFYLTGVVMLNTAFQEAANADASSLVPAMFAAIIIMISLLLRSIYAALATLIVIVATILATMGYAGWMGYFLSMSTVNVPTMVMTLAVADCIHIIASWFQSMRSGMEKTTALKTSLKLNVMPVCITSLTTAIGFLTLNFSDVPILVDLGNLTAIGVMLACVFSLTLLPAILILLPIKPPKQKNNPWAPKIDRLATWMSKNYRRILPYSAIIFVTALILASTNKLNDIAINYFDEDNTFRQAANYQEQHLSGLATMDFGIYSDEVSGINSPNTLITIYAFTQWLRAQPEVDHVSSISDTYRRLNMNLNGDDPTFYTLPLDQELAAQYLLLFEMSLPYGLDLNNKIDMDKSATRINVTLHNLGSKELIEFEQRATHFVSQVNNDVRLVAASPALMFAHIGETNMKSMLKGSLLALVIISLLLIVALKSVRLGLISLLPNLLPAGIGFGIWALISAEINMALSVVLSMTLGIIVDDTVHFLSKYHHAKQENKSTHAAIHYAYQTVGQALVITTAVLTVGFAILTLSSFALNADMGLLTAIILVTALVIDLFFLPAFLLYLDKNQPKPIMNGLKRGDNKGRAD
jgi:predicted RND superfamily exporter protein